MSQLTTYDNNQEASEGKRNADILLEAVAWGLQEKAEEIIERNRDVLLETGNVTDPAGRTFENITALQYALWALDWYMWTMLLKYLPERAIQEQVAESEYSPRMKQHGTHANWQNLIDFMEGFRERYSGYSPSRAQRMWIEWVGERQRLLPMHVLQEYFNPHRPFYPCPDFSVEGHRLERNIPSEITEALRKGVFNFGLVRYNTDKPSARNVCTEGGLETRSWSEWIWGGVPSTLARNEFERVRSILQYEIVALSELYTARMSQRDQLVKKLVMEFVLNARVIKNGEEGSLLFDVTDLNRLVLEYASGPPQKDVNLQPQRVDVNVIAVAVPAPANYSQLLDEKGNKGCCAIL
jgi:hypothetical protein